MGVNSDKITTLRARPVITNIQPMFIVVKDEDDKDDTQTVTIEGHGFWSNKKKVVNGIETLDVEVPFYNKGEHEVLRLFVVPHPTSNRTDQYNIFASSLSSYNLYESSVRPGDSEPTMTTKYPPFTGMELSPKAISENKLTFELPAPLSAAFVDVIVANRAGYSRASTEYFQSSDQSTINMTTVSIPSSGMIIAGIPTYFHKLEQYQDTSKNHYIDITFKYKQTLLFDPFFDRENVINNTVYTYKLATDPDMSNVVQTVTSTSFLNSVTYSPIESNKNYYSQVTTSGGLSSSSNIVEQKTTPVVLQAFEPQEEFLNSLTFRYTASHTDVTGADWQYILAEDKNFTRIVSTRTLSNFTDEQIYLNLTQYQTYWAVLSSNKLNTISNVVSADTNPCKNFVVNLQQPTSAYTISVSALSNEKIYVTEITGDDARGMVQPIVDDQFGNLFIAVGEGFFRPYNNNTPGKLVFDGGWPKWYGYVHEDMPLDSMMDSNVTFSFFQGSTFEHHNTYARWLETYRDALDQGHSIYDTNIFPGEFAYLCNVFKYIQRRENPTGKMLYINDFRDNERQNFPSYGVARFYSTFHDIAEHAGIQLEHLRGSRIDEFGAPKHDTVLQGVSTSAGLSSLDDWKIYLAEYDAVVWAGVQYDDVNNPNSHNYVNPVVYQALEDFYDDGGGLYVCTDHNIFHGCLLPLLSSYGVRFCCKVDRTKNHPAYKIETILNNESYIPSGSHPLFYDLEPNSYIDARSSEGSIVYITDPASRIMINSSYTANTDGTVFIDKHNDGSNYTTGKIQVKTAAGCVSAFNI